MTSPPLQVSDFGGVGQNQSRPMASKNPIGGVQTPLLQPSYSLFSHLSGTLPESGEEEGPSRCSEEIGDERGDRSRMDSFSWLLHLALLDTCITHPNISDKYDNWHCRPIQIGRRWPFCQNIFKKSFVSIWNSQKCYQKLFSDIQNCRRRPFCQKLKHKIKFHMDLKWPEMPSKVNFGHPKWPIDLKWPEMG